MILLPKMTGVPNRWLLNPRKVTGVPILHRKLLLFLNLMIVTTSTHRSWLHHAWTPLLRDPPGPENPHGAIISPSRMETWGSARRLDFSSPPNPFDVPLPVASDINNNDNYFGSICNPRSAEGFVPITATERQALSVTIETLDDIAARIAAGSCGSTSRDNTSLGIISQDVVSERLQDIGAEVFVDTIGCGSTTKQLGGIRPCPWYSFADMSQPETIFLQPTRPVPSAFVTPVTQGTG